jgi:hypothetical protein
LLTRIRLTTTVDRAISQVQDSRLDAGWSLLFEEQSPTGNTDDN